MAKEEIMTRLLEGKLIPVLRKLPQEHFMDVVDALVAGGILALEITMDSDDACQQIKDVIDKYGQDVLVGAGTVIDEMKLEAAIKAGASFIVSPILDENIISKAKQENVVIIPGVFSPTEIVKAFTLGVDMVKLFPASTLGADFVRQIRSPLGDIPIMCTGGIHAENAASYIHAGAKAVGAGSSLIKNTYIQTRDWTLLSDEVRKWLHSFEHRCG